jgi:four helix bundle protein
MHNFKHLIVWQRAIQLSVKVYKFTQTLDSKDQYVFSSQLLRCVCSIPSNIAEGSGKDSTKDFCRFLGISIGSSFELETQLIIIKEIHPNKEEIKSMLTELSEIQRMIFGFKKTLSSKS